MIKNKLELRNDQTQPALTNAQTQAARTNAQTWAAHTCTQTHINDKLELINNKNRNDKK